jgi:hypothetical protein
MEKFFSVTATGVPPPLATSEEPDEAALEAADEPELELLEPPQAASSRASAPTASGSRSVRG